MSKELLFPSFSTFDAFVFFSHRKEVKNRCFKTRVYMEIDPSMQPSGLYLKSRGSG